MIDDGGEVPTTGKLLSFSSRSDPVRRLPGINLMPLPLDADSWYRTGEVAVVDGSGCTASWDESVRLDQVGDTGRRW